MELIQLKNYAIRCESFYEQEHQMWGYCDTQTTWMHCTIKVYLTTTEGHHWKFQFVK